MYIENPDGTPPHLEVFLAIGVLSRFACFCEVLCDGLHCHDEWIQRRFLLFADTIPSDASCGRPVCEDLYD